ncbi:sugar transferase [Derxia gummosa]|uniref:Sugar transferase n=1 Tax=Derxia gummosa DSM 723 TaxID=1121388 RepID=A0A9U5FVA5_9BURK|nr:sugar transferase [Derxia gummosa]
MLATPRATAPARGAPGPLTRLIALLLFMASAPLWLGAALAIRRHGPGPVFFRQRRLGRDGRPFLIWKLRTMHTDAPARLRRWLASDPAVRARWEAFGCLDDDPRICGRAGRFARHFSLDELPQLLNVMAGEMALVGPRPLPEDLALALPPAVRAWREALPPGMTGLWQVRRRSEVSLRQMLAYDRLYARRRSRALDARLLLATLPAVLGARGAV